MFLASSIAELSEDQINDRPFLSLSVSLCPCLSVPVSLSLSFYIYIYICYLKGSQSIAGTILF